MYFQTITAAVIMGQENDYLNTLLSSFGWLLWIPLTHVVVNLSRRFPVQKEDISKGILVHVGLGLMIALTHLIIEWIILAIAVSILFEKSDPLTGTIQYLLYTFHVHFLVYILVIGITHFIDYLKKFQEEQIKSEKFHSELKSAQILALKMQIQPHFLFNTHNSIIGLMLKGETDKAVKMLTRLSELLRYTLDKSGLKQIKLKEELHFIKLYLDIQSIRFSNRLKINYIVEPNVENALVPNFILQPLVENAIKHGIEPYSESGLINILYAGKLLQTFYDLFRMMALEWQKDIIKKVSEFRM
jgi:two-component system, LytTR family, sensor kinase